MTNSLRNNDLPGFRVGLEDNPPSFRIGRNGEILDAVPVKLPQSFYDWLGLPQPPSAWPLGPPPGSLASPPPPAEPIGPPFDPSASPPYEPLIKPPAAPVPQWLPHLQFLWPKQQ